MLSVRHAGDCTKRLCLYGAGRSCKTLFGRNTAIKEQQRGEKKGRGEREQVPLFVSHLGTNDRATIKP